MEAAILKWSNVGGAMISAARSCEENDLEACYRRYLLTYEYAYEGGDVPLASRAVSLAVFALLQCKGDTGLEESRKIGELAVSRGFLNAPMQMPMPGNLVLGLYPAKAYHDDSSNGRWCKYSRDTWRRYGMRSLWHTKTGGRQPGHAWALGGSEHFMTGHAAIEDCGTAAGHVVCGPVDHGCIHEDTWRIKVVYQT